MRSAALSTSFLSRMKLTSPSCSKGAIASSSTNAAATTGRPSLARRTTRSWRLPGSAQWRCASCLRIAASDMGENVLFRPAGEIEQRPRRQEIEAGLRQLDAVLPRQALVELLLEGVEVAYIAGRIFALGIADLGGAPVAGLLLLRQVLAQHLLDQFLEAMAIGVGPHQPRRGPCAIDRRRHDIQVGPHDGKVEAGEMVDFHSPRITQQRR